MAFSGAASEPKKILVVDDDPTALEFAGRVLSGAGYAVLRTQDPRNAAYIGCTPALPDLVLADVSMPGLDGTELCRLLKSDRTTANIPVVLMSGVRTSPADHAKGTRCGGDAYLDKPYQPEDLVAVVRRLVG